MFNWIVGGIFVVTISFISWPAIVVGNKSKTPEERAYEDEEQAKWIKEYNKNKNN